MNPSFDAQLLHPSADSSGGSEDTQSQPKGWVGPTCVFAAQA